MIQPFQRDDAFLADLAMPGELRIWWLGQSGFLARFGGHFVLFDPYLSDSLTKKYAGTDKPHVRMTERVIAPERLRGISVITSSHNHTDHLDADTLRPLLATNPGAQLVIPAANRTFVAQRVPGIEPLGLEIGASVALDGFTFHAVPAAHNELGPEFVGYVVEMEGTAPSVPPGHRQRDALQPRKWTLYHSGDTLLYPGLVETLRPFQIDVALLPINGAKSERRVTGNLDGREAAQLAHEIGARWVVPCHYEMFEFNTADPRELFIPECKRLGQPHRVLRAGEGWTVPAC